VTDARPGEELLEIADAVLRRVPAGSQAEVTVTETAAALTRYANGGIHQSVADRSVRLRLRLIRDGRCGVAEVQQPGDDEVATALVRTADAIRGHSPEGEPVPLYVPDGGPDTDTGFSTTTAAVTPEHRADVVADVCAAAASRGQQAFGAFETAVTAVAMASTAGLRRSARHTVAELIAVCRGADGSGYAARHHSDAGSLEATDLAAEVTERCARNQGAQPIEPGSYQVVLSPYAVAEMLEYLGLVGLGGLAALENRSFMRLGERLMSDTVTITDDSTVAALAPLPFDGEGASTQPVTLIDDGVCRAVVHDSVTASRSGATSTGHSFAQPNTEGPLPRHLCMAAGQDDPQSMIAACERGLLVTRFWYVRPVHPLATIITGMTRDGTFLISDGEVARPVRDLRFTQSIVGALSDVRAISADRLAVRGYVGAMLAPWLRLGAFNFSS
jgi:predicted Zn-dependent protease